MGAQGSAGRLRELLSFSAPGCAAAGESVLRHAGGAAAWRATGVWAGGEQWLVETRTGVFAAPMGGPVGGGDAGPLRMSRETAYLCVGDELANVDASVLETHHFEGIRYYSVGGERLIAGHGRVFCSCNGRYCWHVIKVVLTVGIPQEV